MRWEEKRREKGKERYERLFPFSCHSFFDILISIDEGLCVSSGSPIHSHTQWHSAKKNSTNALTTTHTVKKLLALFTHALHTNSPSSLTIPAHYDGVLMNKSVTDTHTNTFAKNALKVKTMSHLLSRNLSKQHGVARITLYIHTMSRQTQVNCL